MFYIIEATCLLLVSLRLGDWFKIREFQATMLYIALMNFTYYFYTNQNKLWILHSALGHTINETIHNYIINPLIAFIFLSKFPSTNARNKIFYTVGFILAFSLLEGFQYLFGFISYEGGWNYWWSFFLYCAMFPMLRLHFNKPHFAYMLSVLWVLFFLYAFGFL
ncbi:CBO0543 family protein [Paenibacillus aestuarii]|uniref:CBO0543 family protein n=1 Tax=Paenibacillus aestuarii TaxID=516965 RepID=A0ABW0KCH2_9BACL|nr:CBO0543 family protein [Paenibacillus aestuarii]